MVYECLCMHACAWHMKMIMSTCAACMHTLHPFIHISTHTDSDTHTHKPPSPLIPRAWVHQVFVPGSNAAPKAATYVHIQTYMRALKCFECLRVCAHICTQTHVRSRRNFIMRWLATEHSYGQGAQGHQTTLLHDCRMHHWKA